MDRAEFQRYIDNALQEAERVRTYCTQDEIVLIMTADFYRELLATADIHANRDGDHYQFILSGNVTPAASVTVLFTTRL